MWGRIMKQLDIFDVEERLSCLSGLGDQLKTFSRIVNFVVLISDLEKVLAYADGSKGDRPSCDVSLSNAG